MKALKIAIRSLLHFKWYTTINVLGLALSLACVIVIFRYVYGEIAVDRYIPDLDRVYITTIEYGGGEYPPGIGGIHNYNNDKGFIDLRESPAIELWTEFIRNADERVTIEDKPYSVVMVAADSNFNKIFAMPLHNGVLDLSARGNAAISLELSRKLFGDDDPLGKVIRMSSGFPVIITAVIGEHSTASSYKFDLLVSKYITRHWSFAPITVVKLYLNQDYRLVNERYSQFFYISSWRRDIRHQLFPYKDIYLNSSHLGDYFNFARGNRTNVFLLFGAGVLILLVGVVNFINIYLAVVMRRGREWGMKKVFGARGPQIFTQLWVENTLLVAMSLLIALAITEMVSPLVKNLLGLQQIPFKAFDFSLVGIFFVTLPLLTTLIPFLKYNYSMPVNSLRSIGTTGGRGLTRKIFLALQYTITIFMIVIAVFFNRQLYGMLNADPGFRTKNIIHVQPFLKRSSDYTIYSDGDWEKRRNHEKAVEQTITQRMDASPLFEKWTFGDHPNDYSVNKFSFEDKEFKDLTGISANQQWIELFELEVVDGRIFDDKIEKFGNYELILTESALKQYGIIDWKDAKLQPEMRLWSIFNAGRDEEMKTNPPYSILGVVKDFNGSYLGKCASPFSFHYSDSYPFEPLLASFREGDKQQVIEFLRQLHDETVGGEFVYSFVEDDMRALYDEDKKVATVFTIFTMIAILISVMGLFSMSLFDIEQRYNEIAIRKVNGATTGQIISMLLRKYLVLLAIAFVVAVPLAWLAITRYLEGFAFKTPVSWWIFALALVITAGVSLLTLIVQTKKAAETNPATVIRNE